MSSAQDTITGFLLAGVGNIDLRRKSNFLIVDQSELHCAYERTVPFAGVPSPLLCAWGSQASPLLETTTRAIEDAFKDFTSREDIAVVLINQYVRVNRAVVQSTGCEQHTGGAL